MGADDNYWIDAPTLAAIKVEVDVGRDATQNMKFRVLGAHPNRNFFDIEVDAKDGRSAFGVAAKILEEAGEEGGAEFFVAIPAGTSFEMPGDSVVTLAAVLDPEQAGVFGLADANEGCPSP